MSATFSDDGAYRYRLVRDLKHGLGKVLFVMLNPSTADATKNDPTIRRCIGFARDWGFRHLLVGNLFALRATKPSDLDKSFDPVGPENDYHLRAMSHDADIVIAAWGAFSPMTYEYRDKHVMVNCLGSNVMHLGLTKYGHPKHPLYLPKDSRRVRYVVQ